MHFGICYVVDAGARAVAQLITHSASTLRHVRVATTRLSLVCL
jgi:hypothetical protein